MDTDVCSTRACGCTSNNGANQSAGGDFSLRPFGRCADLQGKG